MERMFAVVIAALVGLALGAVAGYFYFQYRSRLRVESAERQAERILTDAETTAKEQIVQARDEAHRLRNEAEKEIKARERELRQEDDRLQRRRASLDDRFEQVEKRERQLNQLQSTMDKRYNQLEKLEKERLAELERLSAAAVLRRLIWLEAERRGLLPAETDRKNESTEVSSSQKRRSR